ncbi:hypothetical protein J437_LFUL006510 [Ladona fulva]|uniref:Endonuclease/exonuclease/phosphatase domain-containing protein n=1 Tax=Ladona fulva TaxID=123851 RepID=A0A8K0NXF4_LADFU|nr:hypothetical protein J437_LFUL006510 [Ladona fulva]
MGTPLNLSQLKLNRMIGYLSLDTKSSTHMQCALEQEIRTHSVYPTHLAHSSDDMTEKEEIMTRAFPASKAQLCCPETVRNGHGLPNQGRVQLKRIGTLNVGNMNGKSREIVDLMSRRKVNILCIQETRDPENKNWHADVGNMNGKSREIVDLMSRRKVNILCIQETRWKGNKVKELAEGYKLIYSGTDERGRNGD